MQAVRNCALFIAAIILTPGFALGAAESSMRTEPSQRVVISDGYTSWLLKGDAESAERYGEGEALPRLLADGWTISQVTPGCGEDSKTIYVLQKTAAARAVR